MASQAIAHPERHFLVHHIHGLYFAMTSLAQDPGTDVRPVIEIDMVRKIMDSLPLQSRSGTVNRGEFLDGRSVASRHRMAVHAGRHSRDPGFASFEHTRMTIHTWDLHDARVKLVRIWDGL